MWIDLTLPFSNDIPFWPNSPTIHFDSQKLGDALVTNISFGLHTGTHMDAPSHFILEGKSIKELNLTSIEEKMQVIETGKAEKITKEHIRDIKTSVVFFKTRNTYTSNFNKDYCFIEPEAAKLLVKNRVKIVGIDYLSVENYEDSNFPTHKIRNISSCC